MHIHYCLVVIVYILTQQSLFIIQGIVQLKLKKKLENALYKENKALREQIANEQAIQAAKDAGGGGDGAAADDAHAGTPANTESDGAHVANTQDDGDVTPQANTEHDHGDGGEGAQAADIKPQVIDMHQDLHKIVSITAINTAKVGEASASAGKDKTSTTSSKASLKMKPDFFKTNAELNPPKDTKKHKGADDVKTATKGKKIKLEFPEFKHLDMKDSTYDSADAINISSDDSKKDEDGEDLSKKKKVPGNFRSTRILDFSMYALCGVTPIIYM